MTTMTTMAWTYLAYLVLSVSVTVWVGRMLRKHGPTFASDGDTESGRPGYVEALTHLLVVGFYLVNFGVISLALRYGDRVSDVQSAIEHLSLKVGAVLVVLGLMLFVIVASLAGSRKQHRQERMLGNWDRNREARGERITHRP